MASGVVRVPLNRSRLRIRRGSGSREVVVRKIGTKDADGGEALRGRTMSRDNPARCKRAEDVRRPRPALRSDPSTVPWPRHHSPDVAAHFRHAGLAEPVHRSRVARSARRAAPAIATTTSFMCRWKRPLMNCRPSFARISPAVTTPSNRSTWLNPSLAGSRDPAAREDCEPEGPFAKCLMW